MDQADTGAVLGLISRRIIFSRNIGFFKRVWISLTFDHYKIID